LPTREDTHADSASAQPPAVQPAPARRGAPRRSPNGTSFAGGDQILDADEGPAAHALAGQFSEPALYQVTARRSGDRGAPSIVRGAADPPGRFPGVEGGRPRTPGSAEDTRRDRPPAAPSGSCFRAPETSRSPPPGSDRQGVNIRSVEESVVPTDRAQADRVDRPRKTSTESVPRSRQARKSPSSNTTATVPGSGMGEISCPSVSNSAVPSRPEPVPL
jgi:hypothetical protein